MSRTSGACLVAIAVAASAVVNAQSPSTASDTSARAVVAKAVAYLRDYKEKVQFVLADELTTQAVYNPRGALLAERETSGEYFLTYLAAEGGWIGVRDITAVDGVTLEKRDNLRELLTRASFARIGRQLVERNAQYNIGSILRNISDPMMALLLLDDKHRDRCRFERRIVERSAAGTIVTLSFEERDEPTLVRGADGRPIRARGEFVIDAGTGRIVRSVITLKGGPTSGTMTTEFSENEKLGLWVPLTMVEEYHHRTSRTEERVTVRSSYSNYRRFNVSVTIK